MTARLMLGLCLPGLPGRYGILCHGAEKRTARALTLQGHAEYDEAAGVVRPTKHMAALATALRATGRAEAYAAELRARLR